jgi:hypothetical protein
VNEHRNLRQYQCVFPFGVGAIWNYDRQCFVAADLTLWKPKQCPRVDEPRLLELLGKEEFLAPPVKNEHRPGVGVPFIRFPRWHFCPKKDCRKMHFFDPKEENDDRPRCANCSSKMIPMRFVIACPKGHLSDVDWDYWIHQEREAECRGRKDLTFEGDPNSSGIGGLSSQRVRCNLCDESKNLGKLGDAKLSCNGRHPWIWQYEKCEEPIRVCQVGASNLRYEHYQEALSIPPYSDYETGETPLIRCVRENPLFHEIERPVDFGNVGTEMTIDDIAIECGSNPKEVENAVSTILAQEERDFGSTPASDGEEIKREEYKAIVSPDRTKFHPADRFQKRTISLKLKDESSLDDPERESLAFIMSKISRLVVIDRLRVVRVLEGFSRLEFDKENMVSANPEGSSLPAVEMFGEGIFVEFDEEELSDWARRDSVRTRSSSGTEPPEFVMLHTLAHLLILQFQYFAGYPASSIRERLYFSEGGEKMKMNGFLLFTAFADAYGGMGGLAKMGQPEKFIPLLHDAINKAETCSNDPVCAERKTSKETGNAAACHVCAYVPETSCSHFNRHLDRSLVAGSVADPSIGFFHRSALD